MDLRGSVEDREIKRGARKLRRKEGGERCVD